MAAQPDNRIARVTLGVAPVREDQADSDSRSNLSFEALRAFAARAVRSSVLAQEAYAAVSGSGWSPTRLICDRQECETAARSLDRS